MIGRKVRPAIAVEVGVDVYRAVVVALGYALT